MLRSRYEGATFAAQRPDANWSLARSQPLDLGKLEFDRYEVASSGKLELGWNWPLETVNAKPGRGGRRSPGRRWPRSLLEEIVRNNQQTLVAHPVIETLINLKWNSFASRVV